MGEGKKITLVTPAFFPSNTTFSKAFLPRGDLKRNLVGEVKITL